MLLRAGASLDGCRSNFGHPEGTPRETAEVVLQGLESGWNLRIPGEIPAAEVEAHEASGSLPYFRGIFEGESIFSYLSAEQEVHWNEIKALVHGVRKYGSYKRYARTFHRDVLVVRGLAQRSKLSTNDPVLNFLARLGDNGVVWHVLEYWRATN